MALNDTNIIYDIIRISSILLFVIVIILSSIALRKLKLFYIIYMRLGVSLIAFSAIFSVLRFWFYPWEFALFEYVFFALSGFISLIIYFEIKGTGEIDGDGLPVGDIIDY